MPQGQGRLKIRPQVSTATESGKEIQEEESLGQRAGHLPTCQSQSPDAEPKLALVKLKENSGTAWVSQNCELRSAVYTRGNGVSVADPSILQNFLRKISIRVAVGPSAPGPEAPAATSCGVGARGAPACALTGRRFLEGKDDQTEFGAGAGPSLPDVRAPAAAWRRGGAPIR